MTIEAVETLVCVYNYEDEWPARIGKFIANLSDWYASHPSLSQFSRDDVATFLFGVFDSEVESHGLSVTPMDFDAAGRTENAVNVSIDCDDLRRNLALAAFERFAFDLAA